MEEALAIHGANVALAEGSLGEDDSRLMHAKTIAETVKLADVDEAIKYRERNTVRNCKEDESYEQYPIIKTPLKEIGDFGVGLELYLLLVKQLGFCFLVIALISVWPIVENAIGEGLQSGDAKQEYDKITLANQEGVSAFETDLEAAEDKVEDMNRNQTRVVIADAIYTFFFIMFILYYRVKSKNAVNKNLNSNITAADYAVQAKGFPLYGVTQEDLKKHFEQFGVVAEVSIARKYNGNLFDYKKRASLSYDLGYEKIIAQEKRQTTNKKIQKIQKEIDKFDKKIHENQEIRGKTNEELPVDRVFVIFEEVLGKRNCLNTYKKAAKCCRSKHKQPIDLKFNGVHPLRVFPATEPSNILWENLEVTKCQRAIRKVFIALTTCIIMAASIAIVYYIKTIDDDLPTERECSQEITENANLDYAKANYQETTQNYCWCKQQSWTDLLSDEDINDFCEDYVEKATLSTAIKYVGSIVVIVINFVLKIILRALSRFERVSSKTKEQLKIMTKVFFAMFINTAFIVLIVNADLSNYRVSDYLPEYVLNGEFSDFSRNWYVKVGSTVTSTMIISIFSPHMVNLLLFYPFAAFKRRYCHKRYKTQSEMNRAFVGPDFDISTHTSQVLNVVFSCFLYSGGIPFLNLICCGTMLVMYWTEKFLILRHYKKPPLYAHEINDRVVRLLPLCVILHCLFSIYMYGTEYIFPTKFFINEDGYVRPEEEGIEDRLFRLSGILFILLMIFAIVADLFNLTLRNLLARFVSKRHFQVSNERIEQESYTKAKPEIKEHGLHSYNIMKNPNYNPLILSINSAARTFKEAKTGTVIPANANMSGDGKDEESARAKTDQKA